MTKGRAGALRKAVSDLMRLELIKESEWSLRSVTSMVICEGKESKKYADYLVELKEKEKHSWVFECIPIHRDGASIYLLTWRANWGQLPNNSRLLADHGGLVRRSPPLRGNVRYAGRPTMFGQLKNYFKAARLGDHFLSERPEK